jgi:predicted dehydrogenase
MTLKLRAGLIGLGNIGRQHARILASLKGVDFVGSFDLTSHDKATAQHRPVFKSIHELFDQQIDYAIVAVPTESHLPVAFSLADRGIHALIEKPLASDSNSALKIADRFKKNGLIGAVGHIERYNPASVEAKKRLEVLGKLHQVSTVRQGPYPGRISDVGVVMDLATHDIDLTRWITQQEYKTISAQVAFRAGRETEDMIIASCSLKSDVIVNHIVNWLSPRKQRLTVLIGENGALEIDTLTANLTYFANGKVENVWNEIAHFRGVSEGDVTKFSFEKREPLLLEHENFRDAILGKESQIVTLEEGLANVRVAEAMLNSSNSNSLEHL